MQVSIKITPPTTVSVMHINTTDNLNKHFHTAWIFARLKHQLGYSKDNQGTAKTNKRYLDRELQN